MERNDWMKRITVFGGSTPKPGDPAYQEAYELGSLIGSNGYAVLTGGYSGTMEAVSRGASEAGGHVIGVTCYDLENWRSLPPNRWIQEEMRYQTLRERMYGLMDHCDLAMALPGGIGTLAEVAAMWSAMQTEDLVRPPIILVGDEWKAVFDTMRATLGNYVREPYWQLLALEPDVPTAFETARRFLEEGD